MIINHTQSFLCKYYSSILFWLFSIGFIVGNNITSLIDGELVNNIITLSIPIPRPPVGGKPTSKAFMKS
mgnify:CR=1 FL=1